MSNRKDNGGSGICYIVNPDAPTYKILKLTRDATFTDCMVTVRRDGKYWINGQLVDPNGYRITFLRCILTTE